MVNPSILILFRKKVDCSLLAVQSVIQKHTVQWIILHYHQLDQKLVVFLSISELSGEKKTSTKTKIWAWIPFESTVNFKWDVTVVNSISIRLKVEGRTRCFLSKEISMKVQESKFSDKKWPKSTKSKQQYFGGKFVMFLGTEAAKDSWRFVLMLGSKTLSLWEQNLERKRKRKKG